MKAIVLSRPKEPELKELVAPVLDREDFVRIGVKAVGLCGSDMQKINSLAEPASYLETQILGHEFSGKMLEVGSKVKNLSIDDRITAIPLIPCKSCLPCEEEHYQLCENIEAIGRSLPGAFSEQVLVPAENVRKIADSTSYEQACLTDVLAVAVHNYHLAGSPTEKKVLVLGDGAVGMSCLQIYANNGNLVDVVGKHHKNKIMLLNGSYIDVSFIHHIQNNSYDVVVETVGRQQDELLAESVRMVKPGGKIIVAGVYEKGFVGQLLFRDLFYKEATLQGSNSYGSWAGRDEFDIALKLMEENRFNASVMITHVLPLTQFSEGVRLMNEKNKSGAVKIIYRP